MRPEIHPKHNQFVNKDYYEWIKRQPSYISGRPGPSDGHHLWGTGKRGKHNDFLAIPLTREEHTQYHTWGHATWCDEYNIPDPIHVAFNYLCQYVEELTKK